MGLALSLERLLVDPEVRLARHREDYRIKSLELSGIESEIGVARDKIIYFHSLGTSRRHELSQWASRYKELEIERAALSNVCDNLVRLISLAGSALSIRKATGDLRFIAREAKVLRLSSEAVDKDIDRYDQERDDTEAQLEDAENGVDDVSNSLVASSQIRQAGIDAIVQQVVDSVAPPPVSSSSSYTVLPSVPVSKLALEDAPSAPPPSAPPLLALLA